MEEPNNSKPHPWNLNDNTLFLIAYCAKIFSYVVITAGTVNLFFAVGKFYFSDIFSMFFVGISFSAINLISPQILDFVMAGVYFIILQAASAILFNIIDITELYEKKEN